MAPPKSERAIRIRGLSPEVSLEKVKAVVTAASGPDQTESAGRSRKRRFSLHTSPNHTSFVAATSSAVSPTPDHTPCSTKPSNQPTWTLAVQNSGATPWKTATVSYGSGKMKAEALERLEDGGTGSFGVSVECDDGFDRLTVLYAPEIIDIDICAVHGLGGHAFDTWMGASKMWLRDLLPNSVPFNRSRVMTFGYNSTLINKKSSDRVKDWADDLLRNVGAVRTNATESARPIIFICHSLGGIVCREAMTRLNAHATNFDGIRLENCGLLFLSTPHFGSAEADWNAFLTNISELFVGVRSREIVDQLRSFNHFSVDAQEAFQAMTTMPPFYCLCEGDETSIGRRHRRVVTQASAGFCGKTADKILCVDHHTICKFDTGFGAYADVLDRLGKLRANLFNRGIGERRQTVETRMMPGLPSVVAPHYPLNEGSKWFEGSGLRTASQLVGREDVVNQVTNSVPAQDYRVPKLFALTGIGGIGYEAISLSISPSRCSRVAIKSAGERHRKLLADLRGSLALNSLKVMAFEVSTELSSSIINGARPGATSMTTLLELQ